MTSRTAAPHLSSTRHARAGCIASRSRGFTLAELMIAMTGGLFVSIAVFALARDGSRFYQREARVAEATLGAVIGFDRLRSDIGRAGYLSTPNLRKDSGFCGNTSQFATYPLLQGLASIRISASSDTEVSTNSVLQAAGVVPEEILLSGAYSSVERFDAISVVSEGTFYKVRLQSARGGLWRLNYQALASDSDRTKYLSQLFPAGRVLRLVSAETGTFQMGVINSAGVENGAPTIYLEQNPALILAGAAATRCNASFQQIVNVVNFVKYSLRKVKGNSSYKDQQVLFDSLDLPWEGARLELVREEVSPKNVAIAGTMEVVAEYAVDLRFGITYFDGILLKTDTFGGDKVKVIAGPTDTGVALAAPQSVRSVRARLSVRSREADRDANIDTSDPTIAPGLYRVGVTDDTTGKTSYARVRTQQSDIFIGSQAEVIW